MSTQFSTVGLIGRYRTPEVAEALSTLSDWLKNQGVAVLVEDATATATGVVDHAIASIKDMGQRADLVIVLGGDGTMLNAARQMAAFGVPLVGVNQGRVGFMTDIGHHRMIEGVQEILSGQFTRENRVMLEASVVRDGQPVFHSPALNDVVISKGEHGRMIELEVRVDDASLFVLRADGLIVATPTGSTAYALSANGPILHPAVRGLALVPVCPHALTNRPITISDDSSIEIEVIGPHLSSVHADALSRCDLRAGDRVCIRRSEHAVQLLHPVGYSYFSMLREKLHWSATPHN